VGYFTHLRKKLEEYLPAEQVATVEQAYLIARKAHQGQKRRSGDAYITHPVAAAVILSEMHMDAQSIMATLLHDVIEDTAISKEELADKFGDEVAELVDGVSKLTQIKFESRAEAQAENFRKMVLAMVRDIRVILVKLADRLHNMRTLASMPREKRRRIARETLDIYAPIANRLGMHSFFIELEDLGFQYLYPYRYRILRNAVEKARGNRQQIFVTIEQEIFDSLKDLPFQIETLQGRQKHLYSIYKKMRGKRTSFAEIMDVYGFRITVNSVDECYRVLGSIHQIYKPLPERFKDYIAIPKANGYQSLHTSLFGPYGVPIEVQIRTVEMDHLAESGIAAHWLYKHDDKQQVGEAQLRARQWVRGLLEMQQSSGSSLEFIESVKIDLFPQEVYVFTPKGDILELPRGSTAVDFAYMIHSDIGNSCVGAKIDRRLAPLSQPLRNGESVEIITAPGAKPNPAWLNFVATGKARSNIRHYLKSQQRAESVTFGRRLLETALQNLNHHLDDVNPQNLENVLHELHCRTLDDLFEAIGLGNQVAVVVARQLTQEGDSTAAASRDVVGHGCPLQIKGTEGMVVKYAECCRPIPGDPIVGVLASGQGVIVHQDSCPSIRAVRSQPELFVQMGWEDDVKGGFTVEVTVEVSNQRGVLALLATAISDAEANIDNILVDPRDGRYNIVYLTLTVRDRTHIARVMRRLRSLKSVVRLSRSQKQRET